MQNKSTNKFMHVTLFLIPFLNQLNTASLLPWGYAIYIPTIMLLLFMLVNGKKLYIKEKRILYLFIAAQIVLPIVSFNIFRVSVFSCILPMALGLGTFVLILFFSDKKNSHLSQKQLIVDFIWGNSIVLCYMFFTHLGDIQMQNLSALLSGNRIGRSLFGFYHPNFLSMYAFTEIVLIYLYIRLNKKKVKKFYFLLLMFLVVMSLVAIISAGSRTAFMCTALFACLEITRMISSKINVIWVHYVIQAILVLILLLYLFQTDTASDLTDLSSGRDVLNRTSIEYIIDHGYFIFGFAPLNNTRLAIHIPLTDCWYIICIAQIGIVGLICWISILVMQLIRLIKAKSLIAENLIICLCCYGAMENVVFNAGVSMSVIMLILIFSLEKIQD